MSKNTDVTSMGRLQSKSDWILCTKKSSWDKEESPGMKLDWNLLKRLLLWKWKKRGLNNILSKILANIGKRLIVLYSFTRFFQCFSWNSHVGHFPCIRGNTLSERKIEN